MLPKFVKVFPHEYRRVLVAQSVAQALVPAHGDRPSVPAPLEVIRG
jgi:hypothetical protein